MRVKRILRSMSAIALSGVMIFNMVSCGSYEDNKDNDSVSMDFKSENLVSELSRQAVVERDIDSNFINSQLKFYVDIFKNSVKSSGENNMLISPLSIMLALSMTANGANGDTKIEMENVLGSGISINELNEYLCKYVENLPSDEKSKLSIANSIWFKDNLDVREKFLQQSVDYYNAAMFKSPFDRDSIDNMNNWVKENTDGMIDKIIKEHSKRAIMYVINAIAFDAEWSTPYAISDIRDGKFNSYSGEENEVEYMFSDEYQYIHDENTVGFIKSYSCNYSFVAMLPDKEIDMLDYIEDFTYEKYINIMESMEYREVDTTLPKFSYDYELSIVDSLKNMGMKLAFDKDNADFSNIADTRDGNISISDVRHKTFISVDENGTKAGAVTSVRGDMAESVKEESKKVILDRPFIYMIIDDDTKLPIFMGVVMNIKK